MAKKTTNNYNKLLTTYSMLSHQIGSIVKLA